MFSKMDQDTVCQAVREEIYFAAQTVNANAFFVVIYDTQLGNSADEGCWYDSFTGLDPTAGQQPSLRRSYKGVAYSLERICQLILYVVKNAYVTLGSSVQHQDKGIPQGAHASSFLANLTCYHFEKIFVRKNPWHSIQRNIFRYCDDFQMKNAPYFKTMYRDIYPASSGITLIPNEIVPQPGRNVESRFLDTLTYVTDAGELHITLYDKRSSYNFEVNSFRTLTPMRLECRHIQSSLANSSGCLG
jgi:hypothetical protein